MTNQIIHKETFELIRDTLEKVIQSDNSNEEKLKVIFQLYQLLLEKITEEAPIGFTSLFARLTYVLNRFNIGKQDVFLHHQFRKSFPVENPENEDNVIYLGQYLILKLIAIADPSISISLIEAPEFKPLNKPAGSKFRRFIPGIITEVASEEGTFRFILEEEAHDPRQCSFENPKFEKQAQIIFKHLTLPVSVNLIDSTILETTEIFQLKHLYSDQTFLLVSQQLLSAFNQRDHFQWHIW